MTCLGVEGERTRMDGEYDSSGDDMMVYWPAKVICGALGPCSCPCPAGLRSVLLLPSESDDVSSRVKVRQRPLKRAISEPCALVTGSTHTGTPVRADAKHLFPILDLLRGHASGQVFDFAAVSTATASEAPRAPQAEPAKLAQVEILPQLQKTCPSVQRDRA
jgi:hypothetical protein